MCTAYTSIKHSKKTHIFISDRQDPLTGKGFIKMNKKIIPKKPYKTNGYFVTKHAAYDMRKRNISKGELG